ncbi:MAG: hypothetical protein JNM70_23870, partial [Anaerolineae bacterium]|nr:hypothetical protein [Anaerolineae bacterium]
MPKRLLWIMLLIGLAGAMPLRAQTTVESCALDLTRSYLSAWYWTQSDGIDALTYAGLAGTLYNGLVGAEANCYGLSAAVIRAGIDQLEPLPEPEALIRTYARLEESIGFNYANCPLDLTVAYVSAVDWSGLTIDEIADETLAALQVAQPLIGRDSVCGSEARLEFTESVLESADGLTPDPNLIPMILKEADSLSSYDTANCANQVMETFIQQADWTGVSAETFGQTVAQGGHGAAIGQVDRLARAQGLAQRGEETQLHLHRPTSSAN